MVANEALNESQIVEDNCAPEARGCVNPGSSLALVSRKDMVDGIHGIFECTG